MEDFQHGLKRQTKLVGLSVSVLEKSKTNFPVIFEEETAVSGKKQFEHPT